MRRWLVAGLLAFAVLMVMAATPAAAQVKNRACPADTVLFGWAGKYGCIRQGTSTVVLHCYRYKTCPRFWTGAGMPDAKGNDICCPRPNPNRR